MKRVITAASFILLSTLAAEPRSLTGTLDPGCGVIFPCAVAQAPATRSAAVKQARRAEWRKSKGHARGKIIERAAPFGKAVGGPSTSRECLHTRTRAVLDALEGRFGKVVLVSTCRPGARMPSGDISWHARNEAFDFNVPKGVSKGIVMEWLGKHSPGVTMSYSSMAHVHTDTGTFHKVIYNAVNEDAGLKAVAIWRGRQENEYRAAALPHIAQLGLPGAAAAAETKKQGFAHPLNAIADAFEDFRKYLVQTATVGGTMRAQTPERAVGLMHPVFAQRLAKAIKVARAEGMDNVGCFSAYRAPGLDVGGYRNKYDSNHAYGLACDVYVPKGGAGTRAAKRWYEIATANGLYNPYGWRNRAEWNHYQVTPTVTAVRAVPALRKTITANGPIDKERMWKTAEVLIDKRLGTEFSARRHARHHRHRKVHLAAK